MCVRENTSQAASVEFVRHRRTNYARSRPQTFCRKNPEGFSTVSGRKASAAIRSMQFTIGDAQGGMRFQGIWGFIVSILISLLLIVAIYFGMLVMLTGRSVMNRLNELLPFIDRGCRR